MLPCSRNSKNSFGILLKLLHPCGEESQLEDIPMDIISCSYVALIRPGAAGSKFIQCIGLAGLQDDAAE
jgi:hypothetical protein